MKLIVYVVLRDKIIKDMKKLTKNTNQSFVHMFDTKIRAQEALPKYCGFGEHPYALVEATIDFETLVNMASCALTGGSYTDIELDILNVWNYGI